MPCLLLAMLLEVLPALSRASQPGSLSRLERKSRTWRTVLPALARNHCEHKTPVPTDTRHPKLERLAQPQQAKFPDSFFDPVDRVHVRFVVPGGDLKYLYFLDIHTLVASDSMCCSCLALCQVSFFDPVDRVHVRFVVPGGDLKYLYFLDIHTLVASDSMCCSCLALCQVSF